MPCSRHLGARGRKAAPAVLLATLLAGVAALTTGGLEAQESALVLEARGGVAVPIGSFSTGQRTGEGTSPGASFGIDFALPGGGRWTPYVGFSQHRFPCADAGCAAEGRYVATGFHGGFRLAPFPSAGVIPWLRVGAVTSHLETDGLGGPNAGRTQLGVGAEVGVGVHIGGASRFALNPAVRAVAMNTRLPGGDLLRMRYLVGDLGLALAF